MERIIVIALVAIAHTEALFNDECDPHHPQHELYHHVSSVYDDQLLTHHFPVEYHDYQRYDNQAEEDSNASYTRTMPATTTR